MSQTLIDIAALQHVCEQCGIYKLCMPAGLGSGDLDALDNLIKRRRPLERGQHLYESGDDFHAIFALRSGTLKTYVMTEDGEEHIVGIKMPGDLLGLSDINSPHYTRSAKALETCSICEIPYDRFAQLTREIPDLHHHILGMMSREIHQEQDRVTMCKNLSAEARLAGLLLLISQRFLQRGFSATEFNLSMSRSDIANMLGLAVETISRLFTQFQEHGLLEVERKHVKLLDLHGLEQMLRKS
ncbi:MAG: fumarate/nitrate reduction transcriptional regulator Fnr [Gammaproteobacteria bacterium]|nr:fumarate/nitrate reduction transcriptional regulator Fnr [Gammaproteobacteria bacterium]